MGGSLFVTGLTVASPQRIALENALDTTPAMLRTVLALNGLGVFFLRVCPPHFSKRAHSRLKCSGVISARGMASSSGAR
jgi:hypothetical protein